MDRRLCWAISSSCDDWWSVSESSQREHSSNASFNLPREDSRERDPLFVHCYPIDTYWRIVEYHRRSSRNRARIAWMFVLTREEHSVYPVDYYESIFDNRQERVEEMYWQHRQMDEFSKRETRHGNQWQATEETYWWARNLKSSNFGRSKELDIDISGFMIYENSLEQ